MITVRPSSSALWRLRIGFVLAGIGILLRHAFIDGRGLNAETVAGTLIPFCAAIAVVELWSRTSWLQRNGSDALRRRAFGFQLLPKEAVSAAYVREIDFGFWGPVPRLVLLDADNKPIVRVRGEFWSAEAIEQLAHSYAPRLTIVDEQLSRKQLTKRFPHFFGFAERRPYVFAGIMLLVLAVLAIAVVTFIESL